MTGDALRTSHWDEPDASKRQDFRALSIDRWFDTCLPNGFDRLTLRRGGFTLIELLVVIAVIALLAALILTGIVAAKKRVQQAQCAHNVRQLGLAVQVFVTDNHVYPLAVNPSIFKGGYSEHNGAWMAALEGILTREVLAHPGSTNFWLKGIWLCPSAPRPSIFPDWQVYGSYGYNWWGLSTRGTSLGLGGRNVWL